MGECDRMSDAEWLAEQFEEKRAHLRSVAYRMLGSLPDAEDQRASLTQQVVADLAALCSCCHQQPFSGASDLTMSQMRLLWLLEAEGPLALRSIASALGRSPSTASQLVERLVRRGLIERTEDAHDRRRIECQLTAVARERLGRTQVGDGGRLIQLLERHSASDLQQVARGLGRLVAALQQPERETEQRGRRGSSPAL